MPHRRAAAHRRHPSNLAGRLVALAVAGACLLVSQVAAAAPVAVKVVQDTAERVVLRYRIDDYDLIPIAIGSDSYVRVGLDGESPLKRAGAPELPTINRSIVIGADAEMAATVLSYGYHEHHEVDVAPSKGIIYRNQDPSAVPYSFGADYQRDAFFPGDLVALGAPYVLRGDRGQLVKLYPFQYNPVRRVLRVYTHVTVAVTKVGTGHINVLSRAPSAGSLAFQQIASHHFVNTGGKTRYEPVDETGEMLIIAHDEWLPNVQPLVDHRNANGITTTAVGVSTIGNDAASIKAAIQDAYDNSNLTFVLLVGDYEQVTSPTASGGASDPSYAKLAGNDHYPDVLIGRFSAETPEQVDTQVERTIAYEQQQATKQPWHRKAVGIGSAEGPGDDGEMDWEHVDNIRNDLLAYGYTTVDQLYDPGAQAAPLSAAINDGRGIINYTGHGSMEAWSTTGFSIGHINYLTNNGKLPFIISVACVNGQFDAGTCFGEAWLRATHAGEPAGAIGIYASSINQSWVPPMAAQDETVDLIVDEQYVSFGALCFAGSALMLDEYGAGGVEMFDTWHIFGDPSVKVASPRTGLKVRPFAGIDATGDVGGPFYPAQEKFTVANGSDFAIDFSVTKSASWITVDAAAGTLLPGEQAIVTVSINEEASALASAYYADTIQFVNETDHDGDTSRKVELTVGVPDKQYDWPLDEDPGWSVEGGWAFGKPAGSGGSELGKPDPTGGHTGDNVYGYNLHGDYPNGLPQEHLTTDAINCSQIHGASLRFWRWLNVEGSVWDHATVSVSVDGEKWTTVWENPGEVADSAWQQVEIDISDIADRQPTVYLRWTMGPTDEALRASGWNIDDVQLWGIGSCVDEDGDGHLRPECGGDDCDDDDDDVHPGAAEICFDGVDNDCDDAVDGADSDCRGSGGGGAGGGEPVDGPPFQVVEQGCGCRLASSRAADLRALALIGLLGLGLATRRRRR